MRNEPSLSSASATKAARRCPRPRRGRSRRGPRRSRRKGRRRSRRSTVVIMDVVVVLPWVPATAIALRPSMTEASAAARCSTRSPRCRASTSSGLSGRIAVDTTSVSAPARLEAACPTVTRAPSAASSSSCARRRGVAAGHADAPGQHDPGDPGHARPADAGEVHPAELARPGPGRHRGYQAHDRLLAPSRLIWPLPLSGPFRPARPFRLALARLPPVPAARRVARAAGARGRRPGTDVRGPRRPACASASRRPDRAPPPATWRPPARRPAGWAAASQRDPVRRQVGVGDDQAAAALPRSAAALSRCSPFPCGSGT